MNASAPFGLKLYRAASRASEPVARLLLKRRLELGKEDADRIGERAGEPGRERPDGALTWIHGASVGESLSVLPLVDRLKKDDPALNVLVTTGTVTSAKLMAERLPAGAFHQFIPIDHPHFVTRFLDHWRPDAALFVESEFWPNLLIETRKRAAFMALVNGRVSPKSFEEWRSKPQTIRYLLSAFDAMAAQDRQNAERLSLLSGRDVQSFGNLKNAAPPLPADPAALAALKDQVCDRPVWLAASTHPSEDQPVFDAHRMLAAENKSLLTIIAPRHPERGAEVAELAREAGLAVARRSKGEDVTDTTDIYIADTLGELGLFYRVSDIAFVGGSITEKGGHNPLEPARLSAAILHGPHVFNFSETYADMRTRLGAALVRNERDLAAAVNRLLADATTRMAMANAARLAAEASGEQALSSVVSAISEARARKNSAA
ncbi:MAG: 3-deoxy-D-manno-octulosonic acid transferase [Parvularculaceae bacterium]